MNYPILAKKAIEPYLKTGKILENTDKSTSRAGVFVCLHLKNGDLRGCIGTFLPKRKNIEEEIIYNAIAAATEDPRFPPVTLDELKNIDISVDILSIPKSVTDPYTLNPKRFGLIVSTPDGRRGLLLPDIEDVNNVEDQIRICKMKAGISPSEKVFFQVFTVKRYH